MLKFYATLYGDTPFTKQFKAWWVVAADHKDAKRILIHRLKTTVGKLYLETDIHLYCKSYVSTGEALPSIWRAE